MGAGLRLLWGHADVQRPEHDLLEHLILEDLVVRILEDVAHAGRELRDGLRLEVLSLVADLAAVRLQQALQHTHEGRLAGTVLSDDRRRPVVECEVQPMQHLPPLPIGEAQVLYLEGGVRCAGSFRSVVAASGSRSSGGSGIHTSASRLSCDRLRRRTLHLNPGGHRPERRDERRTVHTGRFHAFQRFRMRHREGAILEDECIGTGEAGIGRWIHAEIIEILAGEDLPRRVVVDDMTLVHEEHAVTVAGELLDLLLDHDDRDAHLRELVHGMKDLLGALRIELGGRLIEDEDVRLHRKHRADGHALKLTAGQVERIPVAVLPDAEAAEYGLDAGADLRRREAEVLKTVADLVVDRVLRAAQLIERILEDEPDVAAELGHRRAARIHATDRDGAAVRALVKLWDETEQRLAE